MGKVIWPRGGNKRETRLDIARRRERQRDWESCYRKRKRRSCEATPIDLVDKPNESCTGTRRNETCVAPRHVDASRDALLASVLFVLLIVFTLHALCFIIILFPPYEQRWGWGGGGVRCLSLFFFSPVQQTTQTTSGIGQRV